MARTPSNFFTPARKQVLEDLVGSLSTEDKLILNQVGEYSATNLWPWDLYQKINDPGADHAAFSEAIDPLIDPEKIGLRGAFLREKQGYEGEPRFAGISFPIYIMCLELIAQGNGSVALSLLIDGSVLNSIGNLGDEAQIQRYVVDALHNKQMTAFVLTEPGAGTDTSGIRLTAILGEEQYILNGEKNWITNAGWADYYFVVVRTADTFPGTGGLSIIMVHKDEISGIKQMEKHTVPGSYTGELVFGDAQVPVKDGGVKRMIGEQDTGFSTAKRFLTGGRVTMAAYGLGIATEAFEMAKDYAKDREIGGQRVIDFQAKSFELADLMTGLDGARLLTYRAAKHMEEGKLTDIEASMAKLTATELALEASLVNIFMHASYGISKENRAVPLFHDALVGIIGEGTSDVQRAILAKFIKTYLQS